MVLTNKPASSEKVKYPVTETVSRFYQRKNGKAIRILTVAIYVLCVSLAAIMLSLYYIFLWDPNVKPPIPKAKNCDKIIIPEHVAIKLINSTEITAEQFYQNLKNYYESLLNNKQNVSSPSSINNQTSNSHTTDSKTEGYELRLRPFHRSQNYRTYTMKPESTVSSQSLISTTTKLAPTLDTSQRKYLIGINKDDEDDDEDDGEYEKSYDGSGQFLSTENIETTLSYMEDIT